VKSIGGILAVCALLASCATDAPEGPSPYPPTVKPSPTTLTFDGTETCDSLAKRFLYAEGAEVNLAKQAAVLHYERGFATILMFGVNLLALSQTTDQLAAVRGNLIALRDEMVRRNCDDPPEVVFSTPSARTPGSLYH